MEFIYKELLSIDSQLLLSVILALFFGAIIGFEREMTNKWAGLRTHILVSIGSCVFTLLSIHVFPTFAADGNPQAYGDPARVAAQIITGIGFIGGGTVLRHKASIHGLTTASTLWIVASIGMACGCARFDIAFYTTILSVAILVLVRIFERQFIHQTVRVPKTISVKVLYHDKDVNNLIMYVKKSFKEVLELSTKKSESKGCYEVEFAVVSFEVDPVSKLYDKLNSFDDISAVSVKESCE